MYKKFCFIIASFFGAGYFPKASGTFTSLLTLPFAFALAYFYGFYGLLAGAAISFALGLLVAKEVLKYTSHDPALITIDEVAGQLTTFCFVGCFLDFNPYAWWIYGLGFVLFRIFDITKPQPAKWADEKVISAWGVMLDDIFAGIYAGLILWALAGFGPMAG